MRYLAGGLLVIAMSTMLAGALRSTWEPMRAYGPNRSQWLITTGWAVLFLSAAAASKVVN